MTTRRHRARRAQRRRRGLAGACLLVSRSSRGDPAPRPRRTRRERGGSDRRQTSRERARPPAPRSPPPGQADVRRGARAPRCNTMTPPDGLPFEMDPYALDAGTAERLVRRAVDAGDAPPEYRSVAQILHALRAAPESREWAGESATVGRLAAVVVAHRRPRAVRRGGWNRRSSSRAARLVAAAVMVGCVCVTGGFASAGSLPEPAQNAASAVLGTVGISVPTGSDEPSGVQEPGPATAEVPCRLPQRLRRSRRRVLTRHRYPRALPPMGTPGTNPVRTTVATTCRARRTTRATAVHPRERRTKIPGRTRVGSAV
jgi:hypothetical protein